MLDIAVLQEFLYIFITLCSKIEFSGFGGFGGGFSGFFSEESMFDSVGFGWKAGVLEFSSPPLLHGDVCTFCKLSLGNFQLKVNFFHRVFKRNL